MKKYAKQLTLQQDVVQELDRVAAENSDEIRAWFNNLKHKYDQFAMQSADVYNVDDISFRMSIRKAYDIQPPLS